MIDIPDYDIKESIGEGGMATVYLAVHKRLQREIALKVMAPEASITKAFQKSFIAEGRTVAKLEHPHIVKIYDIDTQNGHFYMSMELLRKGSLKQRMDNGKLPVSNALRVTAQIADALSYAHKQGYIHRDIKPANIMFRDDGGAVLTDFGIAKMQGTTGEMTQMGYIAGTPYYMAPEQATGNQQVDNRADIYSLGIVFYEMLTGSKPYTGSNTVAITYEHVHGPIPTLEGENSVFQPILDKALAKKPEERFGAIEDFSTALYEASQTDAKTLLFSPAIAPATVIVEKKPIWPWLVAIAVIGVGGVTGTYFYSKTTEETRIAEEKADLDRKRMEQTANAEKLRLKREADDKLRLEKQAEEEKLRLEKLEAERQEQLEAQRKAQAELDAQKQRILEEKITNTLELAKARDEKRRIFDFSDWSEGCKLYLEDIDGPYDAKDSSEWHYRKILAVDENNSTAQQGLGKINNRKQLEFQNCDKYQRTEEDPLEDLFKD